MARKTIAQLEEQIADLTKWHDEQAERIRELLVDLDNANNEIARLTEKLATMEKSERLTERAEKEPAQPERMILHDKPRRGRRPKIDTETKAYIHALRAATDGEGKPYNSLAQIAEHTGVSKTQVFAILNEPEPVGKWFSEKKDGSRVYYKDYRSAIRSKNDIHFQEVCMMPQTFLSWALDSCCLEEITDLLETLDYAEGDLKYYEKNPTDPDGTPEFIAALKQTQAEAEQELSGIYKEYAEDMERRQDTAQPMDKGLQDIMTYLEEKKSPLS